MDGLLLKTKSLGFYHRKIIYDDVNLQHQQVLKVQEHLELEFRQL